MVDDSQGLGASHGAILKEAFEQNHIICNLDETNIYLSRTNAGKSVCLKNQRVHAQPKHGENISVLVTASTTNDRFPVIFASHRTHKSLREHHISHYYQDDDEKENDDLFCDDCLLKGHAKKLSFSAGKSKNYTVYKSTCSYMTRNSFNHSFVKVLLPRLKEILVREQKSRPDIKLFMTMDNVGIH